MTVLSPLPIQKFFDNNGQPLANGKLFTYKAATSTKLATYIDSTGGTPNTNPIILDYRGECRLWIDPTLAYQFVLAPSTDTDPPANSFWSVDNITAFGTGVNFDNTAIDTGSVNAITVAIPSISAPVAFTRIVVKVANTNTGATTISINGGTAKAVTLHNIAALTGNELQANGIYIFIFDGAQWQLESPALQPPQIRTSAEISAAITPTAFFWPEGWIERYGAIADDSTNCQTAIANAILVCSQPRGPVLRSASSVGIYRHSGTLDWSHAGLVVKGKINLRHTGAGVANLVDAGASAQIYNIDIDGVYEIGNAATTYCWDIRAIHHSRLTLSAKNCTLSGFRIRFSVLNEYNLRCTTNDGAFTTQPVNGLILDIRSAGETVSFCEFYNTIIEGVSGTGITMPGAFGCSFYGGTSESNDTGILISAASHKNAFYNFDFEQNATRDVNITGGNNNSFYNSNFASGATTQPNADLSGGDSTAFTGCYLRWINLAAGATNTVMIACEEDNGVTTGIKGTGSRKIIGVQKVNGSLAVTGSEFDDVGNIGTFTPTISGGTTPGAQTYAANGQLGYYTRVGHVVHFSIFISLTANAGGTGNAVVGGLPFSSRNVTNGFQTLAIADYTGVTLGAAGRTLGIRIGVAASTGTLLETDTASVSNFILIGAIGATASLIINGSYQID